MPITSFDDYDYQFPGSKNGLCIQYHLDTWVMKRITLGPLVQCFKGGRQVSGKIDYLDPMFHDYLQNIGLIHCA
jgi:hypothetical protein